MAIASFAQVIARPKGSSIATRSGLASRTRVSSFALFASSISSEISESNITLPLGVVEESLRGIVETSAHLVWSEILLSFNLPLIEDPFFKESFKSFRKSSRLSSSNISIQPNSRADSHSCPVETDHCELI
ncbi:MAG: Uncharacterised protein [Acidimicrobiaceae bacterium]|nr:MAG: Uncharacterised protein [Acidimicrobiaceae bacterium]